MIGAALQESTSVTCDVEAFPPPDTFEWTLNNSAGSIKVDAVSSDLEWWLAGQREFDVKMGLWKALIDHVVTTGIGYGYFNIVISFEVNRKHRTPRIINVFSDNRFN